MIDPGIRAALEGEFEFDQDSDAIVARRRGLRNALESAGFGLHGDGALRTSEFGGRRPLAALRAGGDEFLLRRFTHGGLLRWLTGRRFLDPERPFVEARLSDELRARGVLTPQVAAARAVRLAGGGWRLDLLTRRVDGARDFASVLETERAPERRATALASFGRWLRVLHDAGFLHADLHPKNVLLDERDGAPRWWILDLDRSVLRGVLAQRERDGNLARLVRYVWRRRARLGVRSHDLARALAAYEPDRAARSALWRRITARTQRTLLLHRAGWWLEARAT